ncbi:24082_t:CDS:2, partial [Cetraspora pellucida]
VPKLEFALKEFILTYQNKAILSEAILVKKAKQLAKGLEILDVTLKFFAEWLYKFKEHNGICQQKLHEEALSADITAIANALLLLKNWLQDFNKEIAKKYKNKKVLLLLDNCKSHKIDDLTLLNVDFHFLSSNTISKIQLIDVQEEKDIKVLKINMLQDEITSETIQNCWNHTNILFNISDTELSVNNNTLILRELAQDITALNLPNMISAKDDKNVDDSIEPLIISASDTSKGLEIVFSFLQQQEDSKELLKNINILD